MILKYFKLKKLKKELSEIRKRKNKTRQLALNKSHSPIYLERHVALLDKERKLLKEIKEIS